MKSQQRVLTLLALAVALALPLYAQEPVQQQPANQPSATTQSPQTQQGTVVSGQKMEVEGVIVRREADSITVRDNRGQDWVVTMTNQTEVKERKSNPFRRAKNYATTQLLRGLSVTVEGKGNGSGKLVASDIKIKEDDLKVASSIESRVTPVEGRLTESERRLTDSEQNAQRLSGQVQELSSVANAARGGAKAAQETADQAMTRAEAAHETIAKTDQKTNERISSLDDYDVRNSATVLFKVGSWILSDEAKAKLDEMAQQAKTDKGFMIEVAGFASAEGGEAYNRILSHRRADAVVQYLVEQHNIPLRRIITPYGFGENQPVADNKTRDGRKQNRRVEVKILMNRGLTASAEKPAGPTN